MFAVAGIGLVVNLAVGLMIARDAHSDLNVKAALYHVGGDAIGAFAVMLGGVAILLTHQAWIDPALSLFVAAIIVAGVLRVVREAADVLLESVPAHVDTDKVRESISRARRRRRRARPARLDDRQRAPRALGARPAAPTRGSARPRAILRSIESAMRDEFRHLARHRPVRVRIVRGRRAHRLHATDARSLIAGPIRGGNRAARNRGGP